MRDKNELGSNKCFCDNIIVQLKYTLNMLLSISSNQIYSNIHLLMIGLPLRTKL